MTQEVSLRPSASAEEYFALLKAKNDQQRMECGLCSEGVSEANHKHVSFRKLEEIERFNGSFYENVYKLNKGIEAGHHFVLVVDTSECTVSNPCVAVKTLGIKPIAIPLPANTISCIKLKKIPDDNKNRKAVYEKQDWNLGCTVNLAQSAVLNLRGNPTHPKCVEVKAKGSIVTAYWQKK